LMVICSNIMDETDRQGVSVRVLRLLTLPVLYDTRDPVLTVWRANRGNQRWNVEAPVASECYDYSGCFRALWIKPLKHE
jgi:hypothetical protein